MTGTGNRSSAVMAQRVEAHDSLDFFPTPPWATRALIKHVLVGHGWRRHQINSSVVWEPACGRGDMARPLAEYFGLTIASDVHDYGYGAAHDFLMPFLPAEIEPDSVDFVITNPPFRLAQQFIGRACAVASQGVAMLVRTSFLEGVGRYRGLFSKRPPLIIAPFVERVPMFKGRLDPKASSATSYCWIVWPGRLPIRADFTTRCVWIPPCRKALERPGDYDPVVYPVMPEVRR